MIEIVFEILIEIVIEFFRMSSTMYKCFYLPPYLKHFAICKTIVCGIVQVLSSSWDGRQRLFDHNRNGPKIRGLCLLWGEAGSPCNTMLPGLKPTFVPGGILVHSAIWPEQIWPENWGPVPLWGRGAGSHVTQCGQGWGLPACQVSSWSIEPFGHNTPTLQTGQTRQDRTDRKQSDSTGRTALQTVAQKILEDCSGDLTHSGYMCRKIRVEHLTCSWF